MWLSISLRYKSLYFRFIRPSTTIATILHIPSTTLTRMLCWPSPSGQCVSVALLGRMAQQSLHLSQMPSRHWRQSISIMNTALLTTCPVTMMRRSVENQSHTLQWSSEVTRSIVEQQLMHGTRGSFSLWTAVVLCHRQNLRMSSISSETGQSHVSIKPSLL